MEFALILLDVSMPGMDGFETAAMIHEHPRFERTPIIFVTGVHDTEFDRLKGYELGAVDYVSIPVVPEILRSKVAVLVELHCKRRDLQMLNQSLDEANKALAEANLNLQVEKARELQALNADLQVTNRELEQSNTALQAQIAERNRVELRAEGSRPAQGRVPGHPGPRAAQSAGGAVGSARDCWAGRRRSPRWRRWPATPCSGR